MSALTVAEVLDRAADLIAPEGAWTRDVVARNADGEPCLSEDADAVCFCALGAIFRAGVETIRADDFFGNFVYPGYGWAGIGRYNDAPDRTQAEVVAKLREAAAKAREQGK